MFVTLCDSFVVNVWLHKFGFIVCHFLKGVSWYSKNGVLARCHVSLLHSHLV